MIIPDLWWGPISKEIEILKKHRAFEIIQRLVDKNVVGFK